MALWPSCSWLKQEPAALPLERREIAGAAHHVELELVAAVRLGAKDPFAADDVEGEKGAGPPGVDQIDGQAEPPFESIFEQQDPRRDSSSGCLGLPVLPRLKAVGLALLGRSAALLHRIVPRERRIVALLGRSGFLRPG